MYMHFCKLKIGNKLFPWDYSLKMGVMKNLYLVVKTKLYFLVVPPLKEKLMKRKDFDLNEIFTYNNLYESYKSVCKSCRSKYKKTFFHFFNIQI